MMPSILARLGKNALMLWKRFSKLRLGLLLLGLIVYTAFTFWEPQHEPESVRAEFEEAAPPQRYGLYQSAGAVIIGLGLLMTGGHVLVGAAVTIGTSLGISEVVIGLSIVAVGTSLPEAAATVVAALRGHGDIAIGNVVGSNLFNILGILGVTSVVRPLNSGAGVCVDLAVMVGVAVALWGLLSIRGRIARMEALLLLTSFGAYLTWLLTVRG